MTRLEHTLSSARHQDYGHGVTVLDRMPDNDYQVLLNGCRQGLADVALGSAAARGFDDKAAHAAADYLAHYMTVAARDERQPFAPSMVIEKCLNACIANQQPGFDNLCMKYFDTTFRPNDLEWELRKRGPDLDNDLSRMWVGSYRDKGVSPTISGTPPIFTVDAEFKCPNGIVFSGSDYAVVTHRRLDESGRYQPQVSRQDHRGLNSQTFFDLGLISANELSAENKAQQTAKDASQKTGFMRALYGVRAMVNSRENDAIAVRTPRPGAYQQHLTDMGG